MIQVKEKMMGVEGRRDGGNLGHGTLTGTWTGTDPGTGTEGSRDGGMFGGSHNNLTAVDASR